MIVIIAIIGIIAVISVSAFRLSGQNTAISTAAATVGSAVSAARQLAISKNCRTRFIIITDDSKPEWKMHRYGILRVQEGTTDVDAEGDVPFDLAGRMDELPVGVYFRNNTHFRDGVGSAGGSMFDNTGSITVGGSTLDYAYIEFLPSGGTSHSSSSNIFELSRAPSADQNFPDTKEKSQIGIGVAQSTGRVKFENRETL